MKKIIFVSIALLILISNASASNVTLYLFWGEGCPHCAAEKYWLKKLERKYETLEIKDFEIYREKKNAELFRRFLEEYKVPKPWGVPATFIGEEYVIGYESDETTGKKIEELVVICIREGCPDVGEGIISVPAETPGFGLFLLIIILILWKCMRCYS
jgi:glutaredoxin